MNAIATRHGFWQQPTNRRLRTTPIGNGVRSVLMAGSPFTRPVERTFLGRDVPINRLDNVSIAAIIGRIQIAPQIQAYLTGLAQKNSSLRGSSLGLWNPGPRPTPAPNFPPMTSAEAQIIFEISKNPSDDELEEIATIDSLFSQNFVDTYTTTNEVCYYTKNGIPRTGGLRSPPPPVTPESQMIDYFRPEPAAHHIGPFGGVKQAAPPDTSFISDKFWCPDPGTLGPTTFQSHFQDLGRFWSFASMFGIDVNQTWGQVKLATQNGITMMGVKSSYPLPPPLDMAPDFVWQMAAMSHTAEIANLGVLADPESFRVWYTMAVLENYDAAADAIIAEQKRKQKKAKRKAIIKAVAFTIAGIVLAFIVPAIIAAAASAIKAAVSAYIDAKKRAEAAKAMAEAAKMFEADAPAFAKEVQNAADVMDEAAAMEIASAPLTQDQIDAIREVEENPEPGRESNTGTLLITGAAATGIVAGLIALLR